MKHYEYFGDNPDFPTKLITFTVLIGAFFGYLNETLLNVALTPLMQTFAVDKTTVQWLTTGFLLVMGAFTPITANVIQWFTTRTMLLVTLVTFLAGSMIAAFAVSFPMLLCGRMIQAVSAAFTVPILFNTILLIYSPQRRGTVIGFITMMFMVAPAIGPTLSGIIVDHFGWRYLFFFTAPFILLSILLTLKYLTINLQEITKPKIDVLSALLSIFGLGVLVYSTSNFAVLDITLFAALFGGSLVLIGIFIYRQFRLDVPLIDLRVFRHKQYHISIHILALLLFVFIGTELIMPMYLQQVVLLSGTLTGLVLLPGSVIQALLSPLMGRLLDKHSARPLVLPGALLLVTTFVLMALFFEQYTSLVWLVGIFTLLPIAVSMMIVSETHGLNALPKAMYPHGTAIISTLNPIAGAVGAATFVGITHIGEKFAPHTDAQAAMMHGVHWVFCAGALIGVVTVILAGQLRKNPV